MESLVYRLKENNKRQKILLFLLGVTLSIFTLIFFDFFNLQSLYKAETEATEEEQPVLTTPEESVIPTPIIDKKVKVCEYNYVLNEVVSGVDKEDNIQDVIKYQNNKVGLYIYAEVSEFSKLASEMVNSNGGEWGYVLIPYNIKDRDLTRWGSLFDRLKELKLIPIIQLHDIDTDVNKAREQTKEGADFLNSLKWPIKNRYISVYNEPNDANFWKGKIDPQGYARILDDTIIFFKNTNPAFFIMNGAFNSSARTGVGHLDTREYMRQMNNEVPGIFEKLDGWASHPYPQPNFSGSPKSTGRDSIQAYKWELDILRNDFGIDSNRMPVFITETGWAHQEGSEERSDYLDKYKTADFIREAFEKVWLPDKNIVAITPFTIFYEPPHDHFSWVDNDLKPYPQFLAVKDIKKVKGKPPIVDYIKSKVLECKYE